MGPQSSTNVRDEPSRYATERGDEYQHRPRRDDSIASNSRETWSRGWNQQSRNWDPVQGGRSIDDPYYQYDYNPMERNRSRPSSRSSVREYEVENRDRYYDRGHYPPSHETNTSLGPPRPSSRSGYEADPSYNRQHRNSYVSNQGNEHPYRTGYEPYGDFYQRDPRYASE